METTNMITLLSIVALGIITLLCIIHDHKERNKIKQDLFMYMDKYKETKAESEKYLATINTINHIYKETQNSILENLLYVTQELKIRLPRIIKHCTVSNKDKKFIYDLILIIGYRLSLERVLDIKSHRFSDLKTRSEYTLKEASEGLLDLINHSKLFSNSLFDKIPSRDELSIIYNDLQKLIEYSNKLFTL